MTGLLLLGTAGCHLCEEAEQMLADLAVPVEIIDIAEQEQWQTPYALRIPVLLHPASRQELAWPFAGAQIKAFLSHLK